jgi:DNA-binding NarL/FixJ family response regulator
MAGSSSTTNGEAFSRLSQQEKQVLLRLSEGRSDQEIAKALFLGEGTLRNYVNSIFSKLGLDNREQATAYALKHNLRAHLGNNG